MTLQLQKLLVGYDEPLRSPISASVAPGTVLGVLGPSGCGKSTLLATVAGLQLPLGGEVILGDEDITATPVHQRHISIVFQQPMLFTHLTVVDNVAYGLRRQGWAKAPARERADELLTWVGLEGLGPRAVDTLSGGQAQRVAIARALAPHPRALLLDEPFSALDAPLRGRLVEEVGELIRASKIPAIHVTHDPAEAQALCGEILQW
jgi:thiamine transport system ATP-binding protein